MSALSKLMQSVTMSSPSRAKAFLSKMNPTFFEKKGANQAIAVLKDAYNRVPAYKKFLSEHKVSIEDINLVKDIGSFKKIPFVDKEKYINKYSLRERSLDEKLYKMYAISSSSGSTGKPTYWPRTAEADAIIPKAIDLIFADMINPKKRSTLIINSLSLGLWSAGDLATLGCRVLAAKKKYKITVLTPGLRLDDTLQVIKDLGNEYDQIMLVGYPPFVKDVIDQGEKNRIKWKNYSPKIMMGGEGITENWRDYVLKKIGSKNIYDVCNLFATADAGIVGFETPFSIILKRLADKNKKVSKLLLNGNEAISIVQYNPMARYLEEQDGEILITGFGGVPLVRYNIHDRGRVLAYKEVIRILSEAGVNIEKELSRQGFSIKDVFKIPIFIAYGRADAVHYYAVNMYRENIVIALEDKHVAGKLTGRFKMGVEENSKSDQKLVVRIELEHGVRPSEKLKKNIQLTIQENLERLNHEYNELCKYLREKKKYRLPAVELFTYKDKRDFDDYKIKHKYTI